MAIVNPPTYLSGTGIDYPPEADRRAAAALITPNGRNNMRARPGVKPGTMDVSAPGNGLFLDVQDGTVVIQSEDVSGGSYTCHVISPTRVTAPAADQSLPRRDVLVARVHDTAARREWTLEIITGVPAASPAMPTLPVNTHALCWYQLGAGVTRITSSMLTDMRLEYVGVGGVLPVRSEAERPNGPHRGMTVFSAQEKRSSQWDGDRYRPLSYVPDRAIDVVQSDYYVLGAGTDLRATRTDRLATRDFPITGSSKVFIDGGITVSAMENGPTRGQFIVRIDGFYAGRSYFYFRNAGDQFIPLRGRAPVLAPGSHSVTVDSVMSDGRAQMWWMHWDVTVEPVT